MVGGVGQSLGLDDVVRIARGESTVVLDTAACERIKKESPPPAKLAPAAQNTAAAHSGAAPGLQPAAGKDGGTAAGGAASGAAGVSAAVDADCDAAIDAPDSAADDADDAHGNAADDVPDDVDAAEMFFHDTRAALLARLLPLINGHSKVGWHDAAISADCVARLYSLWANTHVHSAPPSLRADAGSCVVDRSGLELFS